MSPPWILAATRAIWAWMISCWAVVHSKEVWPPEVSGPDSGNESALASRGWRCVLGGISPGGYRAFICLFLSTCALSLQASAYADTSSTRLDTGFYFPVAGISPDRVTDASFGLQRPRDYPVAGV